MFERFTKRARASGRACGRARGRTSTPTTSVRSTCSLPCSTSPTTWPSRVLAEPGRSCRPAARGARAAPRPLRWTGSATRTPRRSPRSGSTCDEVLRRDRPRLRTRPPQAGSAPVLPRAQEGAGALAPGGDQRCGTTTSAPSTSCSGWCAGATPRCATPSPALRRLAGGPARRGRRRSAQRPAEPGQPSGWVTKSISSSTRPSRAGSRSWKPRTPPRMCFHARAMSAWSRCGQPKLLADAVLPLDVARHLRPRLLAESLAASPPPRCRRTGGPTISTCLPTGDLATDWAIRLSLEPGTRWSTSTPTAALGPGPEVAQVLAEVVDALEVLHDHALDPQVVAPHLLDELGVVPPLDEDPAGPGDARLDALHGHRP